MTRPVDPYNENPPRPPTMTDLERVREFVADWVDSTDGDHAREVLAELYAHLKEDEKRSLAQLEILRKQEAELARLREKFMAQTNRAVAMNDRAHETEAENARLREEMDRKESERVYIWENGELLASREYLLSLKAENARLREENDSLLKELVVAHKNEDTLLAALEEIEDETSIISRSRKGYQFRMALERIASICRRAAITEVEGEK